MIDCLLYEVLDTRVIEIKDFSQESFGIFMTDHKQCPSSSAAAECPLRIKVLLRNSAGWTAKVRCSAGINQHSSADFHGNAGIYPRWKSCWKRYFYALQRKAPSKQTITWLQANLLHWSHCQMPQKLMAKLTVTGTDVLRPQRALLLEISFVCDHLLLSGSL